MANDDRDCGIGSVFIGFVLGAAIGGGLALLLAPRSGEETRGKLQGYADQTRDRLREMTDDAESRIKTALDEGRELVAEKKDLIKAAVAAGKEAMEAERASHSKPA